MDPAVPCFLRASQPGCSSPGRSPVPAHTASPATVVTVRVPHASCAPSSPREESRLTLPHRPQSQATVRVPHACAPSSPCFTHSPTHSLTHSLTHSPTHSPTRSLADGCVRRHPVVLVVEPPEQRMAVAAVALGGGLVRRVEERVGGGRGSLCVGW